MRNLNIFVLRMRLKSLYIKGFKSFANETVLHFNDDVIGVVGPNGSGKSNIVDAIRWVLGEQKSKELRLESMSDVIFNGTKTRKEAPTATVELTFENDKNIIGTEYNSVSISRTLYRSGESEYRLNNVTCRLKDITTLFMDTGIGSNSYAIIALGMVDDILDNKDNARRKMFEQAAGISKYKKRKRETLSKLNATSVDLDRINDLLFEIEGNMKILEKQAKRTKKYFEIKDHYKEIAVNLASRSIKSLKEEYKVLNTKLAAEQDIYQKLQVAFNQKEAEVESEKKKNLDKEIALTEKQKELGKLVSELRAAENEKDLLEQRIEFKSSNIKAVQQSLTSNEQTTQTLSLELTTVEERVAVERSKAVILEEDLEVLSRNYETTKAKQSEVKQLSDVKAAELKAIQDKIYENEKSFAIINNNIDTLTSETARINDQIKAAKEEHQSLLQAEKEIEQQATLKSKELESVKSEESARKEKITELEDSRDKTQEEVNRLNRILDSKQNEYDLLKSMVENFEGFPESIKYLANNWRKDVPILSDLLDVREDYKSIIEQFLEPYLNYYVVQNIIQAKEAIRLLTGAQKGKANFFLLDDLPKVELNSEKINRTIPALDAIKVDLPYQGLLNFLLKDAYIFDGEIDDFIIDPVYKEKVFLSKAGTFIKTKSTISGGSVGLFEGKKIGRKKNLEKIQELIFKTEASKSKSFNQLEKIKQDLYSIKQANLSNNIEKINAELNNILREKVKLSSSVDNMKKINEERLSKISANQEKINALKAELTTLESQKNNLKTESLEVETKFSTEGSDLDILNDELRAASEQYNSANINLIKQQNLIQNFVKDLDYKSSRLKELRLKTKEELNKLEQDKKDLIDSKEQLTLLDIKLKNLYSQKSGFQGNLTTAEQEYYKARNAISTIEEEVKNINRNLNQKQVEINNLKDKFNDVRFKISAVGERLKIEFEININDIINDEVDESSPLEELNDKVEKLKNRLTNYGEINPMALEAYDEIKGRYDNIITQRIDILEAKESLLNTIKEIESTATAQFMESFEMVRENFILVFRSLFTEDDNCDLILVDPDNPLDSDIEIIAKPKGKKPKSLSQLSGGEKTLTATALLFSLYLLKPAPFCIFDEVDAPLDDANIQKFNKIIKKFSSESQFIIVTHNKATMAAVDVLYGVYMQEMGVSGVAPVDFRALKEQPMYEQFN